LTLRRVQTKPHTEDEIITGLITSTDFIQKVRGIYKPDYFGDQGRLLSKWVFDYWEKQGEAPGEKIISLYQIAKDDIKPAMAESVANYLESLSDRYHRETDADYLLEKSREFFEERAYENLYTRGRDLVSIGRVKEAIKLHREFVFEKENLSNWDNPNEPEVVTDHVLGGDDHSNELFKFQGALGELLGPFEKGWLVAILGPMKRGKSFWLLEALFQAVIHKKRVAYINLEMSKRDAISRVYRRLFGKWKDTPPKVRYPLFDCVHNQVGSCPVSQYRENDITLCLDDIDREKPKWGTAGLGDYRVCTYCRENAELRKHYCVDVWYSWYRPQGEYSLKAVKKTIEKFRAHYGDRLRMITYPAYSVTLDDILGGLDDLMYTEGYHPDVVILDYADIVKSPYKFHEEHEFTDALWKRMKGVALDRHQLWITATQANRDALEKELVSPKNVGGNIRKLAHVDILAAINQTEEEKENLITRLTCLVHRHKESSLLRQVMVLFQLAIGMPYLDSEHIDF